MNLRRILLVVLLASAGYGLIQNAAADQYPVILHGKVIMDDGSVPPIIVSIERICSDFAGNMPGVLTDKKGEYIWRMNIDPLETRNCVIRATHAGYTSTEVEVSGVDTTHTTLELPPIKIHAAAADPETINFSDKGIPSRVMGEWKAAIKALEAQNMSEVATHLEAVTAAAPKAPQAWHALGVIDDKLNKMSDARAAFEHAIEVDSKLLPPYVTLTRLCIKTKDWSCAAKTADALIKVDNKHLYSEIYLHQAVARYELKDLNGAQESVEEAIRLDPKYQHPRTEYVLGRILEAKGDTAGAKEHMAKYLQLEPAPQDVDLVRAHIDNLGKKQATDVDPDLESF
jgi:Tfp pilus assembly protein PilF